MDFLKYCNTFTKLISFEFKNNTIQKLILQKYNIKYNLICKIEKRYDLDIYIYNIDYIYIEIKFNFL
jgi:hypothetical protein